MLPFFRLESVSIFNSSIMLTTAHNTSTFSLRKKRFMKTAIIMIVSSKKISFAWLIEHFSLPQYIKACALGHVKVLLLTALGPIIYF